MLSWNSILICPSSLYFSMKILVYLMWVVQQYTIEICHHVRFVVVSCRSSWRILLWIFLFFLSYNRDWRYHKEERIWITRAPGVDPRMKSSTYEQGTYYYFDCQNWRKVAKVSETWPHERVQLQMCVVHPYALNGYYVNMLTRAQLISAQKCRHIWRNISTTRPSIYIANFDFFNCCSPLPTNQPTLIVFLPCEVSNFTDSVKWVISFQLVIFLFKEFLLEYEKLEERPHLPNLMSLHFNPAQHAWMKFLLFVSLSLSLFRRYMPFFKTFLWTNSLNFLLLQKQTMTIKHLLLVSR